MGGAALRRLLCLFSLHDWKYYPADRLHPDQGYRYCARCRQVEELF